MKRFVLMIIVCVISNFILFAQTDATNSSFTVTLDPVEHGSIRVEPPLPADGKIKRGTVLLWL